MKLAKRLELAANAAIIILAIVLSVILIQKYFFAPSVNLADEIKVGEKITWMDDQLRSNKKTILVALQPGCLYCSESAPFYRQLRKLTAFNEDFRLIAILSPQAPDKQGYLDKLNVEFDAVKEVSFKDLKIQSTPTILIVDKDGIVESVWQGKLNQDDENQLMALLK